MSSTAPIPDYTTNPHLKRSKRFQKAAARALVLKDEIAERIEEYDELRTETLLPEMIEAGVPRVSIAGAQVGVVERKEYKKIDRAKLIAALEKRGYDLTVIDEGSVTVDASTYVEVRSPREDASPKGVAKRVAQAFARGGRAADARR